MARSDDDFDASGKTRGLAELLFTIIGLIVGLVFGLIIGALVGGPIGALLGLGLGSLGGAGLGFLLAVLITDSPAPRGREEKPLFQDESSDESSDEFNNGSYGSGMSSVLGTANTSRDAASVSADSYAFNLRKPGRSRSDLDIDSHTETYDTNMEY